MVSGVQRISGFVRVVRRANGISDLAFALAVLVLESLAIVTLSVATGSIFHILSYGYPGNVGNFLAIGLLASFCYAVPGLYSNEYLIQGFLARGRRPARVLLLWNTTFLFLAIVAFLTKSTEAVSRGWVVLFYLAGLIALGTLEFAICGALSRGLASGRIAKRRALLVGQPGEIRRFIADAAGASDLSIDGVIEMPARAEGISDADYEREIRAAVERGTASARLLQVQNVILLPSCEDPRVLSACVDGFLQLPVAISLSMRESLRRFSSIRVAELGGMASLSLTDPPLSPWQEMSKRVFDIVVGSLALVLLAPVLIGCAIAIKLDSKGPVFFRQRRRGFNQREFRIWKFRSMSTLDDGDVIRQAVQGDARITKVGQYLRRFNLDELPQLFNVLAGDMSLVGPRPHAVAHDKHFETRIEAYPRRLNMRPGITGWAQINGFRGTTEVEDKMRDRVAHDVYYIENWSIFLDVYIIAMTVLSPKAYKNAH